MSDRSVSVSRVIAAPPEKIFDVLATPSGHAVIDGSGTVKGEQVGPERLTAVGDRFGMKMKMYGVPYKMSSNVVEFEEDRLIAWAHLGGHRWRYELEPVDEGTRVTETFDWSTAKAPKFIELMGYPKKHPAAMEKTLERLDEHVTA
ncbi:MAG: SRPBCC family protein [Acidimicrobiales bacterium]